MRVPSALPAGVSAVAALVLLTACGGGDSAASSASGSSSASSSAPSSGDAATSTAPGSSGSDADPQTFCAQAEEAGKELDATFTAAGTDVTQVPALLQQTRDRFSSITPPAEVADDWNGLIASVDRLADAAAGLDFVNDPNAFATFEQSAGQEEPTYTAAEAGIADYMRTECGIDAGTGATPSPTG